MGLRKFMDKIKPTFSKGGKLGFLESTFDAFETFLFVPNTTTTRGAHIRDCNDMKRTMIVVVLALIPAFLFGCFNTGLQVGLEGFQAFFYGLVRVLPMVCVSYIVGLGIEFAFAQARGHEVNEGFLVTGLLIPMIFPVSTPLWMVALSTAFAVVFGKEVFGGTGMNVFNPALLARAFAFFAYTPSMSGETVWYSNWTMMGAQVDGITGATALEQLSTTGRRRPGHGLPLPGSRRDGVSGLVAPDRRRLRLRCRLHGHGPRDLGPDQQGQVHRGIPHRCAGRDDPRREPGLSRGHDAVDPLHERAGSAGGLLRGRGEHLASQETC